MQPHDGMNLIIETDLGHDPDDFFAICYLIAAGVNIRHISVHPGDPDQLAVANLIRKFTGHNFTIGNSKVDREKPSSGGIHHELLKHFGHSLSYTPDGLGEYLVEMACEEYDDVEALVIGPATSIGGFIAAHKTLSEEPVPIKWATIQGGFLGYHHHDFPCLRLPQFEGRSWMPTFNLNGDRNAALSLGTSGVPLQYVCKNVCHTVEFTRERFSEFGKPKCAASELFIKAGELYFRKHDGKKFHDPTAAVCHLYPEIAEWVIGRMFKMEGGWGYVPDVEGHLVIADIEYDILWEHLRTFT